MVLDVLGGTNQSISSLLMLNHLTVEATLYAYWKQSTLNATELQKIYTHTPLRILTGVIKRIPGMNVPVCYFSVRKRKWQNGNQKQLHHSSAQLDIN